MYVDVCKWPHHKFVVGVIDCALALLHAYTYKIIQFSRNNAQYYVPIMRLCEQNTSGRTQIKFRGHVYCKKTTMR